MNHNIFNFTIRCITKYNQNSILDYFIDETNNLPFNIAEIVDININEIETNVYSIDICLEARDYGVCQVSIDIVSKFIRKMYSNFNNIHINTFKVHPHINRKGCIIKWDYQNNVIIIDEIIPE